MVIIVRGTTIHFPRITVVGSGVSLISYGKMNAVNAIRYAYLSFQLESSKASIQASGDLKRNDEFPS